VTTAASQGAGSPGYLRAVDIAFSAAGLLVSWPIILASMALISATSDGPAIFRQSRVGLRQRPFVCYKLRTMQRGTPSAASHEVSQSSVTPIGRLLRRTKIDELPQLWNVLMGEMSLVGPRPCLPSQSELIEARARLDVFSVRPGITGPGQIAGVDMSAPARLAALDRTWVENPSASAYFQAIALTLIGRGQGDRVKAS